MILESVRRTVIVALFTTAATALGTKSIEYLFDRIKEKTPDESPKVILP